MSGGYLDRLISEQIEREYRYSHMFYGYYGLFNHIPKKTHMLDSQIDDIIAGLASRTNPNGDAIVNAKTYKTICEQAKLANRTSEYEHRRACAERDEQRAIADNWRKTATELQAKIDAFKKASNAL